VFEPTTERGDEAEEGRRIRYEEELAAGKERVRRSVYVLTRRRAAGRKVERARRTIPVA
jgi:hypothetical protein